MKTTDQQHMISVALASTDAPLSPQWAFVVQFRAAPGKPACAAGRVEHFVSGRTNHFQSLEELARSLAGELRSAAQG